MLRGRVVEEYYSSKGVVDATFELTAGGPICALNIPAGQWHTLRALESGTVILEMKDGAYEPISPAKICRCSSVGLVVRVERFCTYLFWPRWGGKKSE